MGALDPRIDDLVDSYSSAASLFPRCTVLLGDGPYRLTLRICEGYDQALASGEGIRRGTALLANIRSRVVGHLECVRTSELMGHADFRAALENIERLFETTSSFSDSVLQDAQRFVERQFRQDRVRIPLREALTLSVQYVKEEIAIYLERASKGWLVECYMGAELPTLAKIIEGHIPLAPDPLKKRIAVSLAPLKQRARAI